MNKQKKPNCNADEPNKTDNSIKHQSLSVKQLSCIPEKDPRQKALFTDEELKEQPMAGLVWRNKGTNNR